MACGVMNTLQMVRKESLLSVTSKEGMPEYSLKLAAGTPLPPDKLLQLLVLRGRKRKFMGEQQPRPNISSGTFLNAIFLYLGKLLQENT